MPVAWRCRILSSSTWSQPASGSRAPPSTTTPHQLLIGGHIEIFRRSWRCHYIKCASHPRTRATPTRARHLRHLPETAFRALGTPSPPSKRAWQARRTGTSRALLTRHCSPRPQRPPALYFTAAIDQGVYQHLRLKLRISCLWVACVRVAVRSARATRVHAACGAGWSWRRWAWQGRVLGVSSDRSDVQA